MMIPDSGLLFLGPPFLNNSCRHC